MRKTEKQPASAATQYTPPPYQWALKALPFLFWLGVGLLLFAPVLPYYIALHSPDSSIGNYYTNESLRRLDAALSGGACLTPHALLWLFLPPLICHNFTYLLDIMLVAAGAAYYLRGRGLSNAMAWLGGGILAFAGYSFTLISAGHRGFFTMSAYAIFLFGLLLRAVRTGKLRYYALAGACAGWAIDNQPDFSVLYVGMAAVYGAWLVLSRAGGVDLPRSRRIGAAAARLPVFLLLLALTSWTGVRDIFTVYRPMREKDIAASGVLGASAEPDAAARHKKWIFATNWSLPPEETLEFVAPCVLGTQSGDPAAPYWGRLGRTDGWEQHGQGFQNFRQHDIYLGAVPLVLAAFAAMFFWRNRRRRGTTEPAAAGQAVGALLADVPFWSLLAIVSLLLAFGRYTPFYRLFYELPYMSLLRAPVKFVRFVEIGVAMLAALGLGCLLQNTQAMRPLRLKPWIIGAGVLCGLFLFGAMLVASSPEIVGNPVGRMGGTGAIVELLRSNAVGALLHAAIAFGVATLLLFGVAKRWLKPHYAFVLVSAWVALDAIMVNRRFIHVQDAAPYFEQNEIVQRVAAAMPEGPAIFNNTPFQQQDWFRHSLLANGIAACEPASNNPSPDNLLYPFFQAMGNDPIRFWELCGAGFALVPANWARALIGERAGFVEWVGFSNGRVVTPTSQEHAFALLRVAHPVPYAWLSPNWQCVSNEAQLAAVVARKGDPLDMAIVSGACAPNAPEVAVARQGNVKVQSIRFAKEALATRLVVDTPMPQILTVRMPYAETSTTLRALVDGRPVPMMRSDYLWTGVAVPAGSHHVEISAEQHWVWPALSLMPLLIVGLFLLPWGRAPRPPRKVPAPAVLV